MLLYSIQLESKHSPLNSSSRKLHKDLVHSMSPLSICSTDLESESCLDKRKKASPSEKQRRQSDPPLRAVKGQGKANKENKQPKAIHGSAPEIYGSSRTQKKDQQLARNKAGKALLSVKKTIGRPTLKSGRQTKPVVPSKSIDTVLKEKQSVNIPVSADDKIIEESCKSIIQEEKEPCDQCEIIEVRAQNLEQLESDSELSDRAEDIVSQVLAEESEEDSEAAVGEANGKTK